MAEDAPAAAAMPDVTLDTTGSSCAQDSNRPSCDAASSSMGEACTSNAFAHLFRMARAAASGRTSPSNASVTSTTSAPAAPQLASMERDRVLPKKRPAERRNAVCGEHKRSETSVSVAARVRQYKGQMLVESAGVLYCSACKETIQNIKSTIDAHVGRQKHLKAVQDAIKRAGDVSDLRSELISYYREHPEEEGASVPPATSAYRFQVVQAFMQAGIPLSKIDDLRPLLEQHGPALTDSAKMRAFVPKVEAREVAALLQEVEGQFLALAFDGTTRLGEALNVTGRYVTADFHIKQRLMRFVTLAQHADAAALAGVITQLVVAQLGLPMQNIVGFMHDSAAVNGAAVQMLGMFSSAADVMCVAHTLNNVGARLFFPHLGPFSSSWVVLMNSHAARNLWASQIDHSPKRFSSVRWHALAEMQFELATHFARLPTLISQCEQRNIAPASVQQLSQTLRNHRHELRVELAAMLDMRSLVAATYDMEGDRLEILLVYDRIMTLMQLGQRLRQGDVDGMLSNLHAVLRADSQLAVGTKIDKVWPGMGVYEGVIDRVSQAQSTVHGDGRAVTVYRVRYPADGTREELEDEEIRPLVRVRELPEHDTLVRDCLLPAFDYLEHRFAAAHANEQYSCAHEMQMFGALRVFNPSFVASMQLGTAHVDALAVVTPIARLCSLPALKAEVPAYVAVASGVTIAAGPDIAAFTAEVLGWWHANAATLPAWSEAARIAFALSPNSASCERVFSLLESMFGDAQTSALADYLQAALMLRYNRS